MAYGDLTSPEPQVQTRPDMATWPGAPVQTDRTDTSLTLPQSLILNPGNILPFYALICFGCYLLGRLGLAILTFNDVPEAHEELQKEIEQAKAELRRANVDVD
ncbi:hypothetical protein RIB2604_01903460 [Aspergillus luchuensis]|uniref:Dolichol-phosphate mannosyltransferase subunit 3 n=1 Tax=Aspergillus kawachii TaxID=1069201 RepID=A0A146FJM8_ASPKA|nr:hypothetical protein RIB2604_01903460 [Aspergillus luchuensis]